MHPRYIDLTLPDGVDLEIFEPLTIEGMELGKWYDVPIIQPSEDGDFGGPELQLKLMPKAKVVVELDYHGEVGFQPKKRDDIVETFPISRGIFDRMNLKETTPHYLFEMDYNPQIDLTTLDKIVAASSKHERLRPDISAEVEQSARTLAQSMSHRLLFRTLFKFYTFVDSAISGRDHLGATDNNFEFLMEEYLSTGKFSGDCKSVSTFVAGLSYALGLHPRILAGEVIYPKSYEERKSKYERMIADSRKRIELFKQTRCPENILQNEIKHLENVERELKELKSGTVASGGGHQWAEVYIPSKKSKGWFPIDPAFRAFGRYPTGDSFYVAHCALPELLGTSVKSARLKINYR